MTSSFCIKLILKIKFYHAKNDVTRPYKKYICLYLYFEKICLYLSPENIFDISVIKKTIYDWILYIFPRIFPEFFSMTGKIKCDDCKQSVPIGRTQMKDTLDRKSKLPICRILGRFFRLFQRAIEQEVKIVKRDVVFLIRKNVAAFRRNENDGRLGEKCNQQCISSPAKFLRWIATRIPVDLSSTEVRL